MGENQSRMRVLLVAESYPPVLNSGARLFSELARDLADNGHTVSVLTQIPDRYMVGPDRELSGKKFHCRRENGIQVWRVSRPPLPRQVPFLRGIEQIWTALSFFLIGLFMAPQRAVIVYSPPFPFSIVGFVLARLWRGRVILNIQDLYPETPVMLGLMKNPLTIRIFKTAARFLYRRVDAVTVHSEGNRRHVAEQGADRRASVIPNWANLAPISGGTEFRHEQGWGGAFVISYAGVMGFGQGIEDLLDALLLERELGNVIFVLAGEGVFRPIAEQKARKLPNVRFLPMLKEEDYLRLLDASDACLVTLNAMLRTPVVPGKLASAMAAGKAVICSVPIESDVWGIVRQAECGTCIEAGRPDQLAKALKEISRDRQRAAEMGCRGRGYAEREFDRRRCTQLYERILRSDARRSD
jgi:putative colanic acid biosynthesis glycosyltransferase WcaI